MDEKTYVQICGAKKHHMRNWKNKSVGMWEPSNNYCQSLLVLGVSCDNSKVIRIISNDFRFCFLFIVINIFEVVTAYKMIFRPNELKAHGRWLLVDLVETTFVSLCWSLIRSLCLLLLKFLHKWDLFSNAIRVKRFTLSLNKDVAKT